MLKYGLAVLMSACVTANAAFGADRAMLSYSDARIVARVIAAECGGEAELVKISLAAVILNRLESVEYPNTVIGVVTESGELRSVGDGSWLMIGADEIENNMPAVWAAANGADPTSGALLFSRDGMANINDPTLIVGEFIFGSS